jgi:hypothetical protein
MSVRTIFPVVPTMAERVRKAAKENANPARWLAVYIPFNEGVKFEHSEAKRRSNELLAELLSGHRTRCRVMDKKRIDAETVFANLLAANEINRPIAISTNNASYTGEDSPMSCFVPELIKLLHAGEWIHFIGANFYAKKSVSNRIPRIWAKQKLIDYFEPYGQVDAPLDLVVLRNKDKKSISYQDTPDTIRTRELIRHANKVNRDAKVQRKTKRSFQHVNPDLHAVYNVTFEHGGRLYTGGAGYQHLSAEDRADLWIGQKPTVELDYSGLHPRLLYALEGIQYNKDPYTTVLDSFPQAKTDKTLRDFLKGLLFALINAESEKDAVSSGNKELSQNHEARQALNTTGYKVKDIVQLYKQAHPCIAHHFCTGAGNRLMNLDSKIAMDVLNSFTGQLLPILVMHDSFIVQKQFRDKLQYAMEDAYIRHTGGFVCPIK